MGSGASSNVEHIQLEQEDKPSKENKRKPSAKSLAKSKQIDSTEVTKQTDHGVKDTSLEVETLTKQLCESESTRLDLEDKVEALMKELENVTTQTIVEEDKPCSETVHAKDQYIAKLEKDKKDLETETHKLKVRLRRKQKQYNTQMAEYKQEVNFQMMELREEIKNLKSEKKKLCGATEPRMEDEEDSKKLPGGEKMALILELSNQVAEQDEKIAKLENKLKEKDQVISEMRSKMKENSPTLTEKSNNKTNSNPRHSAGDSKPTDFTNRSHVNTRVIGVVAANSNNSNSYSDLVKFKSDSKKGKLSTLDEEDSDHEGDNLVKLSTLLQGTKSNSETIRRSTDSYDYLQSSSTADRHQQGTIDDIGGNEGRDSGLGSAGKREDELKKFKSDANDNLREWKDTTPSLESGSGLSDSDYEAFPSSLSKIHSAPPKLQNGGGVRHKKKSNSLKKHASSKRDRPPKPGEAFVTGNTRSTLKSDDQIINKLTSIISPVEVS